ncbi:MAG TPA: ATP synthase F1 subunit delta [Vicinamibacterales bacterium]|nr:ATP synthase F1 subunit delta [Vicinamibacterales bacterium]
MTSGAAAGRYARALFDVVLKENGDLEKVQADFQQFVALFAQHPVLASTLGNPAIPASKKKAVARALVDRAGTISPVVGKLILLLAERDRLMLLPDIARTYRERLMDHQKVLRGEVTTAVALAPEKLRSLEQGLQQATGRKVMLESKVDSAIIGGVVTRLGSTVYDGSVTTQLQKMKQSLIEAGQ